MRNALDKIGRRDVEIMVSGGFGVEKIRKFINSGVLFDCIGVGSWFYRDRVDFTADVVKMNGQPCAKVGREYKDNARLRLLNWDDV